MTTTNKNFVVKNGLVVEGSSATVNGVNVVTETTTQTLTNKTLTSPKINEDVVLTTTATELNYVDGVTSAIQTQLDGKVDESEYSAKGKILVGTGTGTFTSLSVGGTNGHVLTVDSAQSSGVKWAASSGGGGGGGGATLSDDMPTSPTEGSIWVDSNASVVDVSLYSAPTIGSTSIPSNTTVTTISGLTLSSPDLTGVPTAVTAGGGNNTTQVATTAFVQGELATKANLSGPTFTGTLSAATISASGNITGAALTGTSLTLGTGTISAGHVNPQATNSYDLGTASLRWRNIYTQDLHLSNGIGDYTVIEGKEDLFLVNNLTKKSYKFALIEVNSLEVPPKSEV